jgi:hypothetical protein
MPSELVKLVRDKLNRAQEDWYVHEVCRNVLPTMLWLVADEEKPNGPLMINNRYFGVPGDFLSKHCVQLTRRYLFKLRALVADAAGVRTKHVADEEVFIPWITAVDAACIDALHWYYTTHADIIIEYRSYECALALLSYNPCIIADRGQCMTLGSPLANKIRFTNQSFRFLDADEHGGRNFLNDGYPWRHGYGDGFGGWNPNNSFTWFERNPAEAMCDILITHITS